VNALPVTIPSMLTKARQVLRDALALPPKARADIAGTLLRSLDAPEKAAVDAAWAVEVEQRLREIDSREAKLISWERVRRRLETAVSRGRKKRQVPPGGGARSRRGPALLPESQRARG
jgi:putative addiction module component (TIGR02574 family)